jgi:Alpha/beta hydrolase family
MLTHSFLHITIYISCSTPPPLHTYTSIPHTHTHTHTHTQILANRYGLPVIVPIFDRDIALGFGPPGAACDTGRIDLAQAEFESVEQWVLAGHSLGGVAAMADAWTRLYNSTTTSNNNSSSSSGLDDDDDDESSPLLVGGLAMLASRVQDVGCGDTDFSTTNLPMAFVTASEDLILNTTLAEDSKNANSNYTLDLNIFGGNHAQFGSYNSSERIAILGPQQVDGVAIIPPEVQWDLTAASIYHVASRLNVSLPMRTQQQELECPPPSAQETSSSSSIRAASIHNTTCSSLWIWAPFALVAWLLKR